MENKAVEIYTESNPNPNSLKFVANFDILPGKSIDFPDPERAKNSPLATELFKFSFVQRVFIASNFVTITKPQDANWMELMPIIREFIKGFLEEDKPVLLENTASTDNFEGATEIEQKIISILDEYVRPAVEMDGGAISFKSFDEGKVTVELQGSCSGCPSSTVTLKSGIETLLKRMVPDVEEVVAEAV